MPGAKVFSILDAKCGFWQIPLDEAPSKLTTFMMPSGRYRFLRMPYGISTSSEVFQRTMEHLFDRQPCQIVVDDILVWGCTLQQHDERLKQVLHKIRASNMKLNPDKCKFRVTSVSYVGHLLTADGIKPDPDKTAAVRQMPKPEDKQALQRFLGMTNYLSKFIPHYSDVTGPLRELLKQDAEWSWRELQDSAFQKLKDAVSSPPVLQYFDVTKPVVLSADASQHGLGAVCLQQGAPVAFASRALTPTKSLYAQIEKEMIALVFATQKFHDFIYGRPATVETDHQPLITILKKPLHTASARLQSMMLKLQRYSLNVIYKRGKELFVADALSRAHLSSTEPPLTDDLLEVMTLKVLSSQRTEELRSVIKSDPTCQRLVDMIMHGWPSSFKELSHDVRPFFAMREEFVVENGLIFRGQRLLIPSLLQSYYVTQLHQGHPGLAATQRRAKETMYWPTMYADIERALSRCAPCNALKSHQSREPMHPHNVPDLPWMFTAADIFEWHGKMHLVLVDSFSGWFELDHLPDMRSVTVIAKLKRHFAVHGTPQTLLTDNARQFVCSDFSNFARAWDFEHIRSSPHYPQSNGLAERAVRSAKHLLEKCYREQSDIQAALLHLRNLSRADLPSPAQLLFSRRTRTFLPELKDRLKPSVCRDVKAVLTRRRQDSKAYYDRKAHTLLPLQQGQTVRMQTARGFDKLAVVQGLASQPNSYVVASQGRQYTRNRRHLLHVQEPEPMECAEDDYSPLSPASPPTTPLSSAVLPSQSEASTPGAVAQTTRSIVTRSGRVSRPNPRYQDYTTG